ncbi:MAG TPA: ABC transporter ATP-binding protein/permease [Candidatus Atopostipes pullistercoris]|uniref:ABC transporter ATP-binding protein/permease n=1 Tax=Candidatus Atopostipes pullistercoris TaxID=2838467 RepID=A0A9D2G2Y1_9LACT|nr:ABC transporter ATP-binding protein/permease [Candidatus Atopostipes pullistercoris]
MFHYIYKYWKDNLVVIFILFLTGFIQTIVSVQVAHALDALIVFDFRAFLETVGIVIALFSIQLIFVRIQVIKISQVKQKMSTAIRVDITQRIEKTSYKEFHKHQVGTYASWLSNDLSTIETVGFDQFYALLSGAIATLTSTVALFFFHWSLVLWTLIAGMITIFLPKIFEKQMAKASLNTTKENERFLSRVSEALAGFDTLFSYSLLENITKDTQAASLNLAAAKNEQAVVVSNVTVAGIFGNVFGQISILTLTGFLAFQKIVPIGSFAATSNLGITIFNTLGNVSTQLAQIRSVQPIFKKFAAIKESPEINQEILPSKMEGIELNHLNYAYGEKQVLNDISYRFELGNKYAIVGPSGSGKSTLLNILVGKLIDYSGSARFATHELKEIKGKELRKNILYIDQTPYLFSGTIRENITLGETFSNSAFNQVIKEAALEDIIEKLPDGLDTDIGEAGRLLSGGQRQRIALARGLIRGKRIILIDEGTSSLDESSALRIEENLINNPDLTVLMITHQLRDEIGEHLDGVLTLS